MQHPLRRATVTFREQSIAGFLADVASNDVTPSGGAVAAIAGASGAALCEMACRHTLGKDGYGDVEAELADVAEEFAESRNRLLTLADEDSAAVERVGAAFDSTADGTEQERQEALRRATGIPLETADGSLDVLERATVVVADGNRNALADAVTGALLAHGALKASLYTVRTNLELIDDGEFAPETAERADDIERAGETALEQVRQASGRHRRE